MKIPKKIKEFFKTISLMALATSNKNGNPNVVCIASKKIVNNDTVRIIDTFFKKTKKNILKNNKAAIAMWNGSIGYQIKGKAKYHASGYTFESAKKWILKLKPNKIVKGIVEIKVNNIYSITPNYKEAGKKII